MRFVSTAAAAMLAILMAPSARAAFPGENGLIAFVDEAGIVVQALDGSNRRVLRPASNDQVWSPRFSPDGRTVAYWTGGLTPDERGTVATLDLETGADRVVATAARWPDWSPDGSQLVVAGSSSLEVVDVTSGERAPIPNTAGFISPRWAPDGSLIAAIATTDSQPHRLVVLDPEGSNVRTLATDTELRNSTSFIEIADWSPDSTELLHIYGGSACSIQVYVVEIASGDERPLHPQEGFGFGRGCNSESAAWSPDGTRILYTTGPAFEADAPGHPPEGGLFTVRPDGSDPTLISDRFGTGYAWAAAPDGSGPSRTRGTGAGSSDPGGVSLPLVAGMLVLAVAAAALVIARRRPATAVATTARERRSRERRDETEAHAACASAWEAARAEVDATRADVARALDEELRELVSAADQLVSAAERARDAFAPLIGEPPAPARDDDEVVVVERLLAALPDAAREGDLS